MATFDQGHLAMYISKTMYPVLELYCNTTPLTNLG